MNFVVVYSIIMVVLMFLNIIGLFDDGEVQPSGVFSMILWLPLFGRVF